ncbi:MAG: transketolase family protein [Actinobacteria bacterium]|nr:transketolase family protein [Actinomycetota bacterium]
MLDGRQRAGTMGEVLDVKGPFVVAPFGETLAELAAERPEIVGLTADMGRYSDILPFARAFPDRYFNVGMAEQDLISIAAGLASTGKIAYCTTYAAFVTRRALDFITIGCAHGRANVKIIAGMPGLVNPYGATHQATDDLSITRLIPDLTVIDPCDATELSQVIRAIADVEGTVYVRNLRGKVPVTLDPDVHRFELGRAKVLAAGSDVGIVSCGFPTARALDVAARAAADGIACGVLHVATVKPFDREAVCEFAAGVERLVVLENHQRSGGLATLVVEALYDAGVQVPLERLGIHERFNECGSQDFIERQHGLDLAGVLRAVMGEGGGDTVAAGSKTDIGGKG